VERVGGKEKLKNVKDPQDEKVEEVLTASEGGKGPKGWEGGLGMAYRRDWENMTH